MKLIFKIFTLLFFVILISGCTNNVKDNYDYSPKYSPSYNTSNNNINNPIDYVKPSDAYEENTPTPINTDIIEKTQTVNTSSIIEEEVESEPIQKTCCKYCSKGKACGDSCISRSYTCHKGPGCACDL